MPRYAKRSVRVRQRHEKPRRDEAAGHSVIQNLWSMAVLLLRHGRSHFDLGHIQGARAFGTEPQTLASTNKSGIGCPGSTG
jgi:hypothetical protein